MTDLVQREKSALSAVVGSGTFKFVNVVNCVIPGFLCCVTSLVLPDGHIEVVGTICS